MDNNQRTTNIETSASKMNIRIKLETAIIEHFDVVTCYVDDGVFYVNMVTGSGKRMQDIYPLRIIREIRITEV